MIRCLVAFIDEFYFQNKNFFLTGCGSQIQVFSIQTKELVSTLFALPYSTVYGLILGKTTYAY